MKTQHTPKPWRAKLVPSSLSNNNHFEVYAASPHVKGLIQTVCIINGPYQHENYRANSVLIAAAPDYFEACCEAICAYDEIITSNLPALVKASFSARFRSVENVRAAIAAAEGKHE